MNLPCQRLKLLVVLLWNGRLLLIMMLDIFVISDSSMDDANGKVSLLEGIDSFATWAIVCFLTTVQI